jgi:hypothetical protein
MQEYYEYELVKLIYDIIKNIKIEDKKEFIYNVFNKVYNFNDIERDNFERILLKIII